MFKVSSALYSIYNTFPWPVKNAVASMYSAWSNKSKYGPAFKKYQEFLEKSQWWSKAELEKFQIEQLRELLKLVSETSTYYKKNIDKAGIIPDKLSSLEEFKKLPVINKHIVRENYNDIKNKFASDDKLTFSTSGTTGTSLHVPTTAESLQREYAFRWQYLKAAANATRNDRFAFFTGHSIIPVSQTKPPFFIRNYAEDSLFFSLYHMSDATLGDYVKALNKYRPHFIQGYPSGMYALALFMKKRSLKVHAPKAIFSASEVLHDDQKQLIEEMFGAPVFQWYGQVELTVNIHECHERRMHVKEEYGLLELLKDDGTEAQAGEVGTVVATGWGNKAFPLIRYNTGDAMKMSAEQSCPCGRGGRIVEKIMGRDEDFIITPEGKYVGRLDFVFKPVHTVSESQIIQETENEITVKVVPMEGFSKADEELIKSKLRERIGNSFTITVEKVQQIPRTKNGKIRYVISKIKTLNQNPS